MNSDRGIQNLEKAVKYFAKCQEKVVVKGNEKLNLALETVKTAAEQNGLDPEHITTLVDAAASGYFAQRFSRQLIRCLMPKTKVPQEAVIKAISWMSTNKPPVNIQTLLIRWILVVYDYIDGYDKLHCLYGILFLFLDSQVMLPHLCNLLFLLTRKEDVKLFRVRKLLSLIEGRAGSQSCLIGLLTIYKLYYPNLVSFALPASNKMFFGSFDRNWKAQVRHILEKVAAENDQNVENNLSRIDPRQLTVSRSRHLANRPPPRKKRRLEIPLSHSASADTSCQEKIDTYSLSIDANRVPFVRIDSFVNMLQNVDKIEFPSQIAACLKDPILQHLMAYAGDRIVTARFTFWFQHAFTEEFLNYLPENTEENENLLKLLVELTDFLQEGIPVVDNFLAFFLHTWNGRDYLPYILRLITRCQLYHFDDLKTLILNPLQKLYFSSSVYFKCQCLLSLTELLRNYAAFECPRLKAWTAALAIEEKTGEVKADPSLYVLFPERLNEAVQVTAVLDGLTSFIDKLAVLGLQLEGDNHLLLHIVSSYLSLLSSITEHPGVDHVILPSPSLIRLILFSSSTAALCIMTNAFCKYKDCLIQLAVRQRVNVTAFNNMVVDICDVLWRKKVFSNPQQGTMKALSGDVLSVFSSLAIAEPSSLFSIFRGLPFLPYSWNFLLKTQPAGKLVHPHQLKSVSKAYLEFIQQEHLSAIVRFIDTFIIRKSTSRPAVSSAGETLPLG